MAYNYGYEFEILVGILFGVLLLLTIITIILEHFFPKSKIAKIPERISEWIQGNIRI